MAKMENSIISRDHDDMVALFKKNSKIMGKIHANGRFSVLRVNRVFQALIKDTHQFYKQAG